MRSLSIILPFAHDTCFFWPHLALLGFLAEKNIPTQLVVGCFDQSQQSKFTAIGNYVGFHFGVEVTIVSTKDCFPGDARNRCLAQSSGQMIMFIDVKTIVLEESFILIARAVSNSENLIFGSCLVEKSAFASRALSPFDDVEVLVPTLPGTILSRELWDSLGLHFESAVRAGEDSIILAKLMDSSHGSDRITCQYTGISTFTFSDYLEKWIRNYSNCALSASLMSQLLVTLILLFLVMLMVIAWGYVGVLAGILLYLVSRLLHSRFDERYKDSQTAGASRTVNFASCMWFGLVGLWFRLILDFCKYSALTLMVFKLLLGKVRKKNESGHISRWVRYKTRRGD